MEAFGMYLLKSAVWLTGFTLIFLVFLRNERFFGLNRAFLLSGIFASIIFPMFTWHYAVILPPLPVEEIQIPEMTGEVTYIPAPAPAIPFYWWIYILGFTFLALRLIFQTLKVIKKLRKTGYVKNGPIKIVRTPEYHASFSFFSFVFVNPSTPDIEAQEIVNHESGHIQNRHWFDLLLMELLRILQWFNPFAWVYAHLVRQNHEYLADEIALRRSSNPAIYQAALLNQVFGVPVISLANSFSNSLNKKRFTMMKKKIQSPLRKLRLLMVLPLITLIFYAYSEPDYKYQSSNNTIANSQIRQQNSDLYYIGQDSINISFSSKFERKDLADIMVRLAELGIKINYTSLKFTEEGKLNQISASIKYPDGGGSFSSRELTTSPGPGFRRKLTYRAASLYGKVPIDSSKYDSVKTSPIKTELSKFMILIETGVNGIKLKGIEGCAWKELSFNVPFAEKAQAIDQYGMTQNRTKEESANSSFLFTITRTDNGIALEGIKGTAWIKLSFSCNGNCQQAINQNGMTGNDPLILFDGKVITRKEMQKLDPNSFESVSVLKDESATHVYGEKGRNGVIIIKSKQWNGSDLGTNDLYFYREIDEKPQFPGGKSEMMRFLARNLKYPVIASEKGAEGTALVRFTVTKTGQIDNVNVIDDVDPSLKSEAVRSIMKMPVWDPGKKNGKAVDVVCTIPFKFIINKSGNQQTTGDTRSLPGDFDEVMVVGYGSSKTLSEPTAGEDRPFINVEVMPEFPGGQKEMMKFINNNLKYPPEAKAQGIQGTVVIQFVVTKAGKLENFKVMRGIKPLLDEEALRVLKVMPDWIPGKQGGKAVAVYFTLPFRFVLSPSSTDPTSPPPPPAPSNNNSN